MVQGNRPVAETYEVDQCVAEALKAVKVGPWAPGRLAKPGPAAVSITTSGRDVLVQVRVNGVPGVMAVSTNSALTFVGPAYAKRAGLQIVPQSPTTHARIGEQNVVVPYVRAKTVEVGETSVEALDIVVHEAFADRPAIDGVLGNSFLSHFKMSVDYRFARLALEPVARP